MGKKGEWKKGWETGGEGVGNWLGNGMQCQVNTSILEGGKRKRMALQTNCHEHKTLRDLSKLDIV